MDMARTFSTSAVALTMALTLAACEKVDDPSGAVSTDDAIAAAQELPKPLPGQYTTTFELVDLAVPGLPDAQKEQMRAMFADSVTNTETSCMTAEDAEKGFEEMVRTLGESNGNAQCTIGKFDANGGKLDAALSCSPSNGVTADMTITGNVAPERSEITMAINTKAASIPGGEMTMSIKTTSKRTGDCPV